MKWATGLMFIRMAEALKTEFSSVRCPFVILHDPYDKVANIKGSHEMLEQSLTPPDLKTLVEVADDFIYTVSCAQTFPILSNILTFLSVGRFLGFFILCFSRIQMKYVRS
jgi:hypothetical protein